MGMIAFVPMADDPSDLLGLLGDQPPWVKLIAVVILGLPTAAAAIAAIVTAVRGLTGRQTPSPPPDQPTKPDSPTTPELRRADAEMAAVDRALRILEESQDEDRAEIAALRDQVSTLERQVESRDETIAELRRTLEAVLIRGSRDLPPSTPP